MEKKKHSNNTFYFGGIVSGVVGHFAQGVIKLLKFDYMCPFTAKGTLSTSNGINIFHTLMKQPLQVKVVLEYQNMVNGQLIME